MRLKSLDPRISRSELPDAAEWNALAPLDQHETWEVFHIEKRGEHPVHVGSLHAPTAELALVYAKEQYARRAKSFGLWVVRTADVVTLGTDEDADIFATTPEKTYREASGYRVGTRLTAFKRKMAAEAKEDNG
jgi:ring-1,2-phenylacetyl-CoA epoxidase subunit PaaB